MVIGRPGNGIIRGTTYARMSDGSPITEEVMREMAGPVSTRRLPEGNYDFEKIARAILAQLLESRQKGIGTDALSNLIQIALVAEGCSEDAAVMRADSQHYCFKQILKYLVIASEFSKVAGKPGVYSIDLPEISVDEQLERLVAKAEQMKVALEEKDVEIQLLEEQEVNLRSELASKADSGTVKQLTELLQKYEVLQADKFKLDHELSELNKLYLELEETKVQLESDLEKVRESYEAEKRRTREQQKRLRDQTEEIKELKERIAELEKTPTAPAKLPPDLQKRLDEVLGSK